MHMSAVVVTSTIALKALNIPDRIRLSRLYNVQIVLQNLEICKINIRNTMINGTCLCQSPFISTYPKFFLIVTILMDRNANRVLFGVDYCILKYYI